MKHARRRQRTPSHTRPARAQADEASNNDEREDATMKNTEEFNAYKDFICRMLDRCDLRMIKIIYEFVFAMVK